MRRKEPTAEIFMVDTLEIADDNLILFLIINKSPTYNTSNFDRLMNMSGGRISMLFPSNHLQES